MRLALCLTLLCLPALAAKPVAHTERGSLDGRVVSMDSFGVVVRFLGVSKAEAQTGLDAVAKKHPRLAPLSIGFIRTQASSLAAISLLDVKPHTVAELKALAADCAQLKGVAAGYVYLYPGPNDETLETEAVWTYENGKAPREQRLAFRDDPTYVEWLRRRATTAELEAKKWPSWPLSQLVIATGLPGRHALEVPFELGDLAVDGFPRDVGENLVRVRLYLPDATLLEIRQQAEKLKVSPSKVVHDALSAAEAEQKLGAEVPTSGRAPWDEAMPQADKVVLKPLALFFTRAIYDVLDARTEGETVTLLKLVEDAWRHAHPHQSEKK